MIPQDLIRRKRDGETLETQEIAALVRGISNGSLSDAQVAAFAMAVWFSGMSRAETVAFTLAMRDSGAVLNWAGWDRPIADKHSTGGVGDNISLMLAPIAAACGMIVPMISGRGLGHTGGTLDKLESIPGYTITPGTQQFLNVLKQAGCAIIGQTEDLAPADRRLYAIRDVTATVDSLPLIVASILSKKLASGLQTLVMDVKVGNGAFMNTMDDAQALARSLVDVANGAGVKTTGLITDMNEPLADAVGNALEMRHCIAFLRGEKTGTRAHSIVMALAEDMLIASGLATDHADATAQAQEALNSGRAADHFARMIYGLGGPAHILERADTILPSAPFSMSIQAESDGFLSHCNARNLGMALITLGGGRLHHTDTIDHSVGFNALLPLGTPVSRGQPIGFVHAATEDAALSAAHTMRSVYTISDEPKADGPLIWDRIE